MAQLVILTVLGFKNLKHRLFAPLRRGIWAALLLCTAWASQAQNLTVTVNNITTKTGQASLQAAIEASNVPLGVIYRIKISAGTFTVEDWEYLKSHKKNLRLLERFTITDGISSVADMPDSFKPDLFNLYSYFSYSITSVSIDANFAVGARAFYSCVNLSSISLPKVTIIGSDAFANCSALTTVSLPAATSIGRNAFCVCTALTFLELGATPPTVGNEVFAGCPSPRYLSLVDAEGNPLTGAERTTALANYKADAKWDNNTSTWAGWNLMLSISAMATPAEGGSVSGTGSIASGSTVTLEATPSEGYRFVKWSNGETANPYIFTATDDVELEAEFEAITYTLSYIASEGGTINGEASQQVKEGESGTEVEAVPSEGYRFVKWSDDVATAKRTEANVQGDLSVTAIFELIPTYTLSYTAGEGGSITGQASQSVQHGKSGTEVEAVANEGYRFVKWSDGLTTAKRTDSNVQGNINAMAEFEKTNTTGLFNSKFESLSVYPNPTTGMLWVSVPEPVEGTAANVLVYNTAGKLLQRVPAHGASAGSAASRFSIDLSGYPAGMYIIRVGNAMAKVLKQ